jgi:5-methylcytosine-specific restriction endonuclease McrA
MSPTRRALVLNATFEPLGIVSSRRAVLLVLDTKAELIHSTERVFRAERVSVPEPSVVRLIRYVRVPYNYRVAVNRRTVFARDGGREPGPRDPAQQGRPAHLGERGGRLPTV